MAKAKVVTKGIKGKLADRISKKKKETTTKKTNKKPEVKQKRKKPIGFEMMKSHQNSIEKSFETLQGKFDNVGELIGDYVYSGKKVNAKLARADLVDIMKEAKVLRTIIQEAKTKLKPIYKE